MNSGAFPWISELILGIEYYFTISGHWLLDIENLNRFKISKKHDVNEYLLKRLVILMNYLKQLINYYKY
jgi:hypothetical protein